MYMKSDEKCVVCDGDIDQIYLPMKEWGIDGHLCSKCYSKKMSKTMQNVIAVISRKIMKKGKTMTAVFLRLVIAKNLKPFN